MCGRVVGEFTMAGIPGWPPEFILNKQYGAQCGICRNQAIPIGIYKDCEFRHNTCGTCFAKHSWDEKKQMYECPRCVYERMVAVKKNIEKWMEEKSFVRAPEIGPGAFKFSEEAARKKAVREGKDNTTDIVKRKTKSTPAPSTSIDSIDDVDETSIVRKSMQRGGSSASTMTMEQNGTMQEYAKAKQVDDCEYCKSALCMDCIWEVVNPT